MVRRWKQANKIIEAQVEARRAAGIPDPKWYEDAFLFPFMFLLSVSLVGLMAWGATLIFTAVGALSVGIAMVVLLGATGQVLRGIGEQRQSRRLKAWGYYLGALAYIATASVALFNGLPRLLAG